MSNESVVVNDNSSIFARIRASIRSDLDVLRSFAGNSSVDQNSSRIDAKSEEEINKIVARIRKEEDSSYIEANERFVSMYSLGNKEIGLGKNQNKEQEKETNISKTKGNKEDKEKEYERGE